MAAIDHVHTIPLGDVKAFIIDGEKTILVDTGIKPVHPDVFAFFEEMGIKIPGEKELQFMKKGSYPFIMDFIQERE